MESIEYLQDQAAARELKINALELKIEALELKHESLRQLKDIAEVMTAAGMPLRSQKKITGDREERVLTSTEAAVKNGIEDLFRKLFKNENYSRPTYEATSSLMLCMRDHKKADSQLIRNYVNATVVSLSRYTRMLRGVGLLSFEGSRRKGYYSLTPKGEKFLAQAEVK